MEEAACELFLERGYDAVSVADITSRAGVSRSTFFNYFPAKSDLLWSSFDAAVRDMHEGLTRHRAQRRTAGQGCEENAVADALRALARTLPPGNVTLALSQSHAMGLGEELRAAQAQRVAGVADVVAEHLEATGQGELAARAQATAYAGALLAAIQAWAGSGAGRADLLPLLEEALGAVAALRA